MIIFDLSGTLVKMRPPRLLISKKQLKSLAKKYPLGIITGGSRIEVLNILKKLDILDFFKEKNIITKDDSALRKPDPKLITYLIQEVTSRDIYIGDAKKDYRMVQLVGIKFIYIGKLKIGDIQLSFNYDLIEESIDKLLLSRSKQ